MDAYRMATRLEEAEWIDPAADSLATVVSRLIKTGPFKDLLSGTWLGHSLHPVLTDVPIGTWLSASILDVLGGKETDEAAQILLAVGLLTASPTVWSGLSDWSDTLGGERRVGTAHAASNVTASMIYGASLLARRRGRRGLGVVLGLAGAGVTAAGAYLGGHLSLAMGLGVDHTAFEHPPEEWTPVMDDADLAEGAPKLVDAAGVGVMLVRQSGALYALSNRCTHLGGPLDEGALEGRSVICPWHASRFDLATGEVLQGPARSPEPAYDVRVQSGVIELKARPATA